MGIREITGYIAHVALLGYWIWVISSTAPQLRKGCRDRQRAARITIVKSAAIVLTALLVGVIHFWATEWWHVIAAVAVTAVAGVLLRRYYRTLVAAPRHRLTLRQRTVQRGRPGLGS
ncbi:MAG TPA: hypothetical protein VGH99_03220 [Pseudonocardia sp.]|jgi:O-antigen/teichoic acid export membrane protein